MTSADVTSHQHSALSICHLSLSLIIVNHDTWAEFSAHEACINQDFPHHLTLQLSTPPMMVAFECHRLQVLTLEVEATSAFPTSNSDCSQSISSTLILILQK